MEIHGSCDPRFERVREAFAENFEKRGEVGAAVAVTIDGRPVVDLWGGFADKERTRPWERDTIVNTYSTTKGMATIVVHRLVEQGLIDLEAPVARYWPEFAQAGKGDIPVHFLLSHRAGLAAIDRRVSPEDLFAWDPMIRAIEAQEPNWEPGTKHGYHAITFGHLVGEVVRRVAGRTLGQVFRDEVAGPLGADFHIGFGPELDHRVATMIPAPPLPPEAQAAFRNAGPDSLPARVFGNPSGWDVNSRGWRAAEIPAANGHGTARALARIYGALARGGELDGVRVLSRESIQRATTEQASGPDAVILLHTRYGLGFWLSSETIPLGKNLSAFGHPGAGGSVGFADPEARLGFGYVMNQMATGLTVAGTGATLTAAVYECLG